MATIQKSAAWQKKNPGLVKAWRKQGHRVTTGKTGGKGGGGSSSTSSNPGSNKPGWGRWAKVARTIDVVSGPAQGSVAGLGVTKEAGIDAANRYLGGEGQAEVNPGSNMDTLKATYGSIGTGLARDYARSKLGIYRGVGQKKLLSIFMASNPELLAYGEQEPLSNPRRYNAIRTMYDRAYESDQHIWETSPSTGAGSRFWKSVGLDLGVRAVQHIIFDTTGPIKLNRLLPKGWNA